MQQSFLIFVVVKRATVTSNSYVLSPRFLISCNGHVLVSQIQILNCCKSRLSHIRCSLCFPEEDCPQVFYFDLTLRTAVSCFYLSEEALSFYKAREKCDEHHTWLATVDTEVTTLNVGFRFAILKRQRAWALCCVWPMPRIAAGLNFKRKERLRRVFLKS